MKKRLLFFSVLCFTTARVALAQTNPQPQALPYRQQFDSLAHADTRFPAGWQGWALSGAPSGAFNTSAPAGDKVLLANGSASSTTNGTYNYNSKLGLLNSGSADNSLVLVLNTAGQRNVRLSYDVMTLRNPYDSTSNTRINEVILQYRIGVTGTFTGISGTEYQNNTQQQTGSGVTTPQNVAARTLVLPPACDNQPVVQLRWVNRQISGAGSRPGFAVDNIIAAGSGADTVPPVISLLQPANGDSGVAPGSVLIATFSENIQPADTGFIQLADLTHHTSRLFSVKDPALVYRNNTLTLQATLQPYTTYQIRMAAGVLTDISGNSFAGFDAGSNPWQFSTGAQQLAFDFNSCVNNAGQVADGFTQYSAKGAQVWACNQFGASGNGIQINGFSGGAQENEDWLISPAFDFTGFQYPLLQFASRKSFSGPDLELLVSTDYSGSGDPRLASWTPINGKFLDIRGDVWKTASGISLADFKQSNVFIAFKYTSSPALQAARWSIDQVRITDTTAAPAPAISSRPDALVFDYIKAGNSAVPQSVRFWGNNHTDTLVIYAPAGFAVSRDSINYGPQAGFTAAEINAAAQTLWVTFKPDAPNRDYTDSLRLADRFIKVSGTSLRSLKVVNWNIEWFGSPAQNPANDSLQQANVIRILRSLDADIYALAEVVDTARFRAVAAALPGYRYIISDFGSYADSTADPDYVSAQKLAFLYKDSIVRNIRSYGVLRRGGSGTAYYNWSSGRFPYLMEATARLNGDSARLQFVLLHAKANTGSSAEKLEGWNRRRNGNKELKDSLDAQYPNSNLIMLGDFNDDLYKTITTERYPDSTSSYTDFLADSVHYVPVTRPLSIAGQRSTVSFSSVIDNVIISDETKLGYLPGSATIQTQVEQLVNAYSSTTTDHYPVASRYNLQILGNPAPVERFSASVDTGRVKLSWYTPYELHVRHFVVERTNLFNPYTPVDTVAAHDLSSTGNYYQTYDNKPWLGTSAYRLKTVLADGTVKYSGPVTVTVRLTDVLQRLLWCIFGHHLQIWVDWNKNEPARVQLIDLQGKIRYEGRMTLNKGRNVRNIDIHTLPDGIYFLRIQTTGQTEVSKIVVNH